MPRSVQSLPVDALGEQPEVQPRWLSPDERQMWLVLSRILETLPGALDAQLRRDAQLTYFEYMVLAMLSEQESRTLRMSQLAAVTNGSLSRLSHVATRLESKGFLRRESCPGDGRFTNAVLTDDGYAKIVSAAPGHVDTVRALVFDPLTPAQQEQLRGIGDRILLAIDPVGPRLPVGAH
jgi:DNA-binding MarR family transcriptional regulator